MMSHYLDFAATSAERPREVVDAVAAFLTDCGATPGRGGYARALDAGRMVRQARRAVQDVLGLGACRGHVVFGAHATQALNTALMGTLRAGDVLVVTDFDHNAVLRPAAALSHRGITVRRVPGRPDGSLDPAALEQALDGATLVSINAASNVLGTRLPVARVARLARAAGAAVLVDAAQTAGHVVDDLTEVDLVAVTGHKGLLGPQGVGALWIREGVQVEPLLRGGTGGDSRSPEMPEALPDRLEAGTLNGAGISGLLAGIRWAETRGLDAMHQVAARLKETLHEGLSSVAGVTVLSPRDGSTLPIVTIVSDRIYPGALAHVLDRDFGVQCRSGLHCAPGVHRLLGTEATGAVRFSLGWSSTEADVRAAVEGVARATASPQVAVS
jgi:selenocysteine lyase/cysteine desulfurase